ncbi:MAG TPA: hypothetical protein VH325_13745 [Bryobacteraceae bacterium]|nr:hypothetical protein [Bryobacteraceae bacterium]
MNERRVDTRLLCAELVEVNWKDKSARQRRRIANLEDISLTGACLQMELPITRGTGVSIRYGDGELVGSVRYCLYRDLGYFIGIEFAPGCKWSSKHFRPRHLLNPKQLVQQASRRTKVKEIREAS